MKKTLYLNNLNIEVIEEGNPENQTIIFAHGLGANVEQWRNQIKYFDSYHVVSISLQGHGQSEKPTDDKMYTLESYLDTYTALIDCLNIKECIWIGNSMGGVLGYGMIKRHPKLIKQLITNGTTPKLVMPGKIIKFMVIADKLLIRLLKFDGYIKFASNHATTFNNVKSKIYDLFALTTPQTIICSHQILGDYDYLDQLKDEFTSIYIIKSPLDKDINKYLKKYFAEIATSHVTIIDFDETGHICNLEKPDEYNSIINNIITAQT